MENFWQGFSFFIGTGTAAVAGAAVFLALAYTFFRSKPRL
jgi:hypothetical protein